MATPFPGGCRGAVSLTYDDALNVHLDLAMPDLESHGLRGTFYVPTRQYDDHSWVRRPAEWRAAFERGHEVGNHTQHHPCARKFSWVKKGHGLEDYDLASIEAELRAASDDIAQVVGRRAPISFAYTCGQDWVSPQQQSFRPVAARLFPASRGIGPEPAALDGDLSYVPSLAIIEKTTLDEITGFIDTAIDRGGWAVLMFHGVGGEHNMNCARPVHQALCRWIESRKSDLHCDTFVNVAQTIRQSLGQPFTGG